MSACRFIASNGPLAEVRPSRDYPLHINIDTGTVYDGGADDNFFLLSFAGVGDYTDKRNGVSLEWEYTNGRANRIIAYIKAALGDSDAVEFWHVWLMDCYEFEDMPFIHRKTISIDELTPEHLQEINDAVIWNTPDRMYPQRPSFYCLTVTG